jgi:23S rRNA (adenine2503-C2)-methyltransferase
VDPIWYYEKSSFSEQQLQIQQQQQPSDEFLNAIEPVGASSSSSLQGWSRKQLQNYLAMTATRQSPDGLSHKAVKVLNSTFGGTIEDQIATLSKITTSKDGTTKLLLELKADKLQIETVIIPWDDRQKSTLCVSSQVGCRQACTFCSTGRMGILRSLTASEILAQFFWAQKICRLQAMHPIDNIVFMGMGEPADNGDAVVQAANIMVDRNLFKLTPRRVTISTVAPTPESFAVLGQAPVVLAWSVHSSRDEIRRQLVPTTKYTMEELRHGLIATLKGRSKRLRNIMLEVTLLDQINDSQEDAEYLAEFCGPLFEEVPGIKLLVNLIPWNDISASFGPASAYRKPRMERVLAYQKILVDKGILSYIRTTRGDQEDAACGMLSTTNRNK